MRLFPIWPPLEPTLVEVPIPSWPPPFEPQHLIAESCTTAQKLVPPEETERATSPVPRSTEAREDISPDPSPMLLVDPIPNWPLELWPQHLTIPVTNTTQFVSFEDVIETGASVVLRLTAEMLAISPTVSPTTLVLPWPSCP